MKKITILRNGRTETWDYIDSMEVLKKYHKKNSRFSFVKDSQANLIKEGHKLLVNDCGGYNFLLSSDKIIEIN